MTRSSLIKKLLCMLLIATTIVSCKNDDRPETECEDAVCTLVFVMINVTITDQNQDPVALDSFQVVDLENGNDMTISLSASELEQARQTGTYPLITDGVLDVNQERQLQFRGFQNMQQVISSDYTVATDCCHVGLVSGDLQLTL